MTTAQIISIVVFLAVMVAVVTEKVHRTVAALLGAVILIFARVITFDIGISHVDFNTLGVLLGMMLFVGVVKESGLFEYVAIKSARVAKGNPWVIMVLLAIVTAVLSAFLDNVTTVLLVGPMTLIICRTLELNPVPFFMTQIMASNIGGTATMIGDPPNIIIGSAANLSFLDFLANDAPAVVLAMAAVLPIFYILFGRDLKTSPARRRELMGMNEYEFIKDYRLLAKSLVVGFLVIMGFVLHDVIGVSSSTIALSGGGLILLLSGYKPEIVTESVEWTTIGFFAGLFMVVGAMVETGVIDMMANFLIDVANGNSILLMIILLWSSAILSSFLDNIPFVATIAPIIIAIGASGADVTPLWWALSLGACLGGNGTLIGASANVVLASISEREGYTITFIDYLKVGFPIMLVTVAVATVYLLAVFS